ncbi:MAG TPA: hypothetical protein VKN36_04375 [Eudoraea sp.]|nr:hypothetical protein [Eudoraea sp.]
MRYTPVFTIEIEHDYFSESRPQLFRIVPTSETESLLRGAGLIAKFIQNKLFVLVRHLDNDTPLLKLSNDFKLQFFLEVIGFDFAEITNYRSGDPYNRKLYFSNANSILDGNEKSVNDILYLNEKLPPFNVANAYRYNDLVRSGSDIAYECLKKIDANTGNLNNSAQFRQLEKVSYASPATELLFTGPEKIMPLTIPSAAVEITYFQYDPGTQQFDKELKKTIIGPETNPTNADLENVLLNFYDEINKPFADGIYRVTINAQEVFLYFRLENDWRPYLGLITIHNDGYATVDKYRFIKDNGTFFMVAPANTEVETRNYRIRFAPAQYLLKYICKTNKVTNITDDDGTIEFDNLGGNIFQSKLPVRMNEKSIDTISVSYDGSDVLKKTKTPGHQKLSILDNENRYIVSETFLNL